MDSGRVVDVRFTEADSFGSGYMLTDRLVLTARHVAPGLAIGSPCAARTLAGVGEPRPGRLKWISSRWDVAVAELDEAAAFADSPWTAPAFGRVSSSQPRKYPCLAIGFPRALRIDGLREEWTLDGFAYAGVRANVFNISPTNATPTTPELWRGFSGAAVFNGEVLMAVVRSVPDTFGGGVVQADPAWGLLEEPEFVALVAGARDPSRLWRELRPENYYAELHESVKRLYCFVDRDPQVSQVSRALAAAGPGRPPSARGFLVTGLEEDQPRLFIDRMAQHESVGRLVGDMESLQAITRLRWPSSRVLSNPAEDLEDLKDQLAALLSAHAMAPDALADALHAYGRPLAIWWRLDLAATGRGHAELLEMWLDYCAAASGGPTPLLWFVCAVLDPNPGAAPSLPAFLAGRRDDRPDPRVGDVLGARLADSGFEALEPLASVKPEADLDPWLALVGRERRDLSPEDRRELRFRIDDGLAGRAELRLLPFTQAVGDSLKDRS